MGRGPIKLHSKKESYVQPTSRQVEVVLAAIDALKGSSQVTVRLQATSEDLMPSAERYKCFFVNADEKIAIKNIRF